MSDLELSLARRAHTTSQDAKARSKVAWDAVQKAEQKLNDILDRIEAIEERTVLIRYLDRCGYCGRPSVGPVCALHEDLL